MTYFSHVTKAKKTKGEVITSQKNEDRTKRAEVASQVPPLLRRGTRKHLCYVYRVSMTGEHLRLLKIVFLMDEERFVKFYIFLLHSFIYFMKCSRNTAYIFLCRYINWTRATYINMYEKSKQKQNAADLIDRCIRV